MKMTKKVKATDTALQLIDKLESVHGDLMFHQSGGCCDGSSPMCYPRGEFRTGESDILLGEIGDTPFYMSKDQYEYWKHTQLDRKSTRLNSSHVAISYAVFCLK